MDTPSADDVGVSAPEGEELYQRLIEGASDHAIFMLDTEGRIIAWPLPAKTLYGYESETILGHDVRDLFANDNGPTSDTTDLLGAATDSATETERWHERADGSVFWATMTISPLQGDTNHGYTVVSHDTTAKKQHEQMLEHQNDRLKEFTDILAHDLRNPLNMIDQLLELYQETGDNEHIHAIEETTDRMERLVDDLLRVARQGNIVTDPDQTDIEEVITTAWHSTGGATDGATLHYDEVQAVSADTDRLCELFENLFRNAIEHAGNEVAVRVGPLETGIYIEDDGPGIPEDTRDEVFDHGFTTHEDGSGYGLSVVRTIASAHGWDVTVTPSDAGGARFEITGIEFI